MELRLQLTKDGLDAGRDGDGLVSSPTEIEHDSIEAGLQTAAQVVEMLKSGTTAA